MKDFDMDKLKEAVVLFQKVQMIAEEARDEHGNIDAETTKQLEGIQANGRQLCMDAGMELED